MRVALTDREAIFRALEVNKRMRDKAALGAALSWLTRVEALGWGPLDLFGCDGERRLGTDREGLIWLLKGGRVAELTRHRATVETVTGCSQIYERRPY